MARYRMTDGSIVDTTNASASWGPSATDPYGRRQTLYRSRRGRYYVEHVYQWRGTGDGWAEWLSEHEATRWLLVNWHVLPQALEPLAGDLLD